MTGAAALLPIPPRPPHDPLWQSLDGRSGWHLALDTVTLAVDAADCALTLPPLPGTARVLGEESGSLGGLVLPANVALDDAGNLWLLDRKRKTLRWFDRCRCVFVDAPCQGLKLIDPRAIAVDRGRLYLVDTAPPGRLLVLDTRALVVRALWQPPASAQPWQPTALAVGRGVVIVADATGGALHRFTAWGGWLGVLAGVGAISRLAFDCCGLLYAVVPGQETVVVRDPSDRVIETPSDPAAVSCRFSPPPFPVARSGAIDLTGWCKGAGWFDLSGAAIKPPEDLAPVFPSSALAFTSVLDSRIARCQWHRIVQHALVPTNGAIRISTTTAESELPDSVVATLPDSAWAPVPTGVAGETDALILSPPGRYLWLRINLTSDGVAAPRLFKLDIEYPRISLRRYLPAAFGADPISASFADRLLSIFDRGFRDIESVIDDEAALFDPRSTPSSLLSWLASWVGVTLDKRWPEARRRSFLRAAAKLFACRGTWLGLRGAVLLWLGWDKFAGASTPPGWCAPGCAPPMACPPLPPLVLEHWKLRRWLFLGAGRIGDAAELWGAKILNRSQLDVNAQIGVTTLDATRDPLRDPFHHSAHRLSLFVPAHAVATPRGRGMLTRLLEEQRPAHVRADIIAVHPRMRIGIQASLGFDTVVGCWPSGITLGDAQLGRATVLSGAGGPAGLPPRLGHDSRLRAPALSSSASTGEVLP